MAGKSLASLNFILGANIKDFQTKMRIAKNDMKSIGQEMKRTGAMMTLGITAPLTALSAVTVSAASDAEEIYSKFSVVYRDIATEANAMADSLDESFGLSSVKARELLADTGDLLTGFGFTQESALQLAGEVNKLAVDLASFTNFSGGAEGASVALTKALLGESEQAKALGIVLRQDSDEYKTLVQHFQDAEGATLLQAKALAALEIAQKQSANALGDYARTSESFANQQRELKMDLQDLSVMFGEIMMPLAKQLQSVVRGLIGWFKELSQTKKNIITVVAGLAAAFGPLLTTIGFMATNVIPGLVSAFGALRAAFTALMTTIAANPIGALVTVLGLAAGALLLFKSRSQEAADAQWELGDAIKDVSEALGQQIWEELVSSYTMAGDKTITLTGSLDNLAEAIDGLTKGELESLKLYLEKQYADAAANASQETNELLKQMGEADMSQFAAGLELVNERLEDFKKYTGTVNDFFESLPIPDTVRMDVEIQPKPVKFNAPKPEDVTLGFDVQVINEVSEALRAAEARSILFGESYDVLAEKQGILQNAITQLTNQGFHPQNQFIQELIRKYKELGLTIADTKKETLDFSRAMQTAISQQVVAITDAFVQISMGTANMGKIFQNLLGIVANFLQQFGEALIASALAGIAFQMVAVNPWAAMAAGVATVALASVVRAVAQRGLGGGIGMKEGGIVPSGFPNDTYPALLSSGETVLPKPLPLDMGMKNLRVEVVGKIGHDAIYLANQKYQKRLNVNS